MSEYDKEHIGKILMGHGDWFTAQLIRLIAKADPVNLIKLECEYYEEVQAVKQYRGW